MFYQYLNTIAKSFSTDTDIQLQCCIPFCIHPTKKESPSARRFPSLPGDAWLEEATRGKTPKNSLKPRSSKVYTVYYSIPNIIQIW